MAVLSVKHGWGAVPGDRWPALVVGAAIGLFQGSIATRLAIPSFVVTLAGLLAWQGAQLEVLGDTGTVNLTDPTIIDLAGTFLDDRLGWMIAASPSPAIVGVGARHAPPARRPRRARGRAHADAR